MVDAESDIVFMWYDEKDVDRHLAAFREIHPNILEVSGVRGINECHAKACEVATTEFFWLIDGDNMPNPGARLATSAHQPCQPPPNMNGVNVVGYNALNPVNHIVSAHGGIKYVRKAARDWFLNLDVPDYSMTTQWRTAPNGMPLTIEEYHLDPYQAFRTAYKEVARMLRRPENPNLFWDKDKWSTFANFRFKKMLWQWTCVGMDAGPGGVASICGAVYAFSDWVAAKQQLRGLDWNRFADTLQPLYATAGPFLDWSTFHPHMANCLDWVDDQLGEEFQILGASASQQYKRYVTGFDTSGV